MVNVLRNLFLCLLLILFLNIIPLLLIKHLCINQITQNHCMSSFLDMNDDLVDYIDDTYYFNMYQIQIQENYCKERYEHILFFLNISDNILAYSCNMQEYSICIASSNEDNHILYCEWKNKPALSNKDLFTIIL